MWMITFNPWPPQQTAAATNRRLPSGRSPLMPTLNHSSHSFPAQTGLDLGDLHHV